MKDINDVVQYLDREMPEPIGSYGHSIGGTGSG